VYFSATATVTIVIDDINDNAPVFTQRVYRAVMSENYAVGTSVISVSATDADIGSNGKLMYSLKQHDREYFTIATVEATNSGVLKVHKVSHKFSDHWSTAFKLQSVLMYNIQIILKLQALQWLMIYLLIAAV